MHDKYYNVLHCTALHYTTPHYTSPRVGHENQNNYPEFDSKIVFLSLILKLFENNIFQNYFDFINTFGKIIYRIIVLYRLFKTLYYYIVHVI